MGVTQKDIKEMRADFENSILGAILLERGAFAQVCDVLSAKNFMCFPNAEIYQAITELYPDTPIDLRTVNYHLRNKYRYELAVLISSVSSTANIKCHAVCLLELSIIEAFIQKAEAVSQRINVGLTLRSALNDVIQILLDPGTTRKNKKDNRRDKGDPLKLISDEILVYLKDIGAHPDILAEFHALVQKIDRRIRRIKEQSKVQNLIRNVLDVGAAPTDPLTKMATNKLADLLLSSVASGKLDEEKARKIIDL